MPSTVTSDTGPAVRAPTTGGVPVIWIRCACVFLAAGLLSGATYEVGPGRALSTIGAVPWATLRPGDVVLIHHRAEPYREKWVLGRSGTEQAPIVVRGVPAADGSLPVIEGEDAVTAPGLDFWNDDRGLLKIGGASTPSTGAPPAWIVIEGLQLQGAYRDHGFTDDHGAGATYRDNAAGIYIEMAAHLVIRDCVITGNGNGIFCAGDTSDVLIEGCHIHGNGVVGRFYEHNTYTEATGIVYRGNRFGPLRDGATGNNLKDRSAGLKVLYNWIEGGNRALDLVDSDDPGRRASAAYGETWVVGNVLVERDDGLNSQVVHYGGDGGDASAYRKGVLQLHYNTVFSERSGNTTLLRLSTAGERCLASNNIVHVTAGGDRLAMLAEHGELTLVDNWCSGGFVASHDGAFDGSVTGLAAQATGSDPGFVDPGSRDFGLTALSVNRGAGSALAGYDLDRQYLLHRRVGRRYDDGAPDRGAFERHAVPRRRILADVAGADVDDLQLLAPPAATVAGGRIIDDLFADEDCRWRWRMSAPEVDN